MTPEIKILIEALDELNGLLEADALPDECIPRSIRIEVLLHCLPEDGSALAPEPVARALTRLAKNMEAFKARWMVRLHANPTRLQ